MVAISTKTSEGAAVNECLRNTGRNSILKWDVKAVTAEPAQLEVHPADKGPNPLSVTTQRNAGVPVIC